MNERKAWMSGGRRTSSCVLLVVLAACSPAERSAPPAATTVARTGQQPPPSITDRPPSPRPAVPARAAPGESLIFQKGNTLFELPLALPDAKPVRLYEVSGAATADRQGRYVVVRTAAGIEVRDLRNRLLATVHRADSIAFGQGTNALATVRPFGPRHEHDCNRPTELVDIDLVTGRQRALRTLDRQFVADTLAAGKLVGSITDDCEVAVTSIVDLTTGGIRRIGSGGFTLRAVDPNRRWIWVQRYPDRAHPHGSQLVVDFDGVERRRLPYSGEAVFGPDVAAYTQVVFGDTPATKYESKATLFVSTGLPAPGDRNIRYDIEQFMWSRTGQTLVGRTTIDEPGDEDFRAVACTRELRCRTLALRWFDDVTLLAVVPGTSAH